MALVGAFDAKTHLAESSIGLAGERSLRLRAWRSCGDDGPCRETSARMTHREIVEGMGAAQAEEAWQDECPSDGGRGAAVLAGIVIDAFVALAWCFPDEASEYADGYWLRWKGGRYWFRHCGRLKSECLLMTARKRVKQPEIRRSVVLLPFPLKRKGIAESLRNRCELREHRSHESGYRVIGALAPKK